MKTNMYVSVACLATLLFASCSKETTEPTPQTDGKNARLELVLSGTKVVNGRATGAALPGQDAENTIKRLTVAIFVGENVSVIQEFTTLTDQKVTFECSPGVGCTGIVVANAKENFFSGITTKNDFLAKTIELADSQTSDNLPMSGTIKETDRTSFDLTAGTTSSLAVELSRLVSRVSISSIKTDFSGGAYKDATFKLKKIFLHNAKSNSTVALETPTTQIPVSGETDAANSYLLSSVEVDFATNPYTAPHWFYTFADAGKATKLILWGEFTPKNGTPKNVYYPIVVNKDGTVEGGSDAHDGSILRNRTYAITATIKGIGVDDVDDTIEPATIELTVSVANWVLNITQDVEFE